MSLVLVKINFHLSKRYSSDTLKFKYLKMKCILILVKLTWFTVFKRQDLKI